MPPPRDPGLRRWAGTRPGRCRDTLPAGDDRRLKGQGPACGRWATREPPMRRPVSHNGRSDSLSGLRKRSLGETRRERVRAQQRGLPLVVGARSGARPLAACSPLSPQMCVGRRPVPALKLPRLLQRRAEARRRAPERSGNGLGPGCPGRSETGLPRWSESSGAGARG